MPDGFVANIPASAPAVAVVLGTNDIASAIGWHLHQAGWGVLLLRDPAVPVLRRGMAFDDAPEAGQAMLDGTVARAQLHPGHCPGPEGPLVSRSNLAVVLDGLPGGAVAVLVDAQLRKYAEPEDLRSLAAVAIGVGPGFTAGSNVHVAVESLPGAEGDMVAAGATALPSGQAVPLGGAGSERFVYTARPGTWVSTRAPGDVVAAGDRLGTLGGECVEAPIAGRIRGMVRPRRSLPRGTKLVEIDPRPDAPWQGIPPRAGRIGRGVLAALEVMRGATMTTRRAAADSS